MSDLRETQDYLAEVIADRDRLRAALERIAATYDMSIGNLNSRHVAESMVGHARAALAGDAKPEPRELLCDTCAAPLGIMAEPGMHGTCSRCAAKPASAPHRIPEANDRSWLCFHCDERFTDREEARQHFGEMRTGVALCQEPRDVQDALRRARDAENRWMDVAAKLGVERTENERLAHMLASWERQFGTTDPREAWNRLDSMEGRALAAEERLSAPPPPAPATEPKCPFCGEPEARHIAKAPGGKPRCIVRREKCTGQWRGNAMVVCDCDEGECPRDAELRASHQPSAGTSK